MKFDELLEEIGEFGPYQKRIFVFVGLFLIVSANFTTVSVFLLEIPDYRCALPLYKNDTYAIQSDYHRDLVNRTIPLVTNTQGETIYSKCKLYNVTDFRPGDNMTEYECNAWVYDTSVIQTSGITDFDMVCKNEILRSLANMMLFAGVFPAAVIFGPLADFVGRKKTMLLCVVLTVGASVASSLSPNYEVYVGTAFLCTFASLSLFMIPFVAALEVVGPSKRSFVGIVIEYFWVAGLFTLTELAYLFRQWRDLRLVIGVPPILFLSYWWLIPESPRWLISKGKNEVAYKILRKMAKSNKVVLDEATLKTVTVEEREKTVRIWKMFTSPVLLLRSSIIIFNWVSISMVYYGLTLNVGNLSGDIYLNFFLSSVMELVAYVGSMFFMNKVGRKTLLCATQILGGVACLATIFPVIYGDSSSYWILVTLSMLGKLGSSMAYAIIYVFAAELFPTVVRQSGMSTCTMCGMVGGMVAPYISDLGILVKGPLRDALPLIVFGSVTIMAGITACVLPETRNQILPDTMKDAIVFGKTKKNKHFLEMQTANSAVPKDDPLTCKSLV